MELLIETTSDGQVVDLGKCLGGTSRNSEVVGGTIDWGDESSTVKFTNGEYTTNTKFRHTYTNQGEHTIKISGKIGWGCSFVSSGDATLASNDIRKVLKEIIIPEGKVSPIYDIGIYAFHYAAKLTSIPSGLFDNCTQVTTFSYCFDYCTSLTSIPSGLFDNCTQVTSFSSCFYYCTFLTTIPSGLFDHCTQVTTFHSCFADCTSLASIPLGLFDNCTLVTSFYMCFFECRSIISEVPKLWETHSNAEYTHQCFYRCTSAVNYFFIPEAWR